MLSLRPMVKFTLLCWACSILVVTWLAWPGVVQATVVADSGLDQSFQSGSGLDGAVFALQVQNDGKIIVGGSFTNYDGIARTNIARFEANGMLDSSFDANLAIANLYDTNSQAEEINFLALQPDGKVVIVAEFVGNSAVTKIVRLNANGSLDNSFTPGNITGFFNKKILALRVRTDGKILLGGNFSNYNQQTVDKVVLLNADGTLDNSFNPIISNKLGAITVVTVQNDGKIIYGGYFFTEDAYKIGLLRLNADGTKDESFAMIPEFNDRIKMVTVQTDGKLLVAGNFDSFNGVARPRIARLNSDASLDNSFHSNIFPEASSSIHLISLQADGKILVAGDFNVNEVWSNKRLARLNTDGSPDTTFTHTNEILGAGIYALAIQNDNKILVGGSFQGYNGAARSRLVRLNTNSTLDDSFNTGRITGADNQVQTVVTLASGKILIGGYFRSYNGVARKGLARLNSDGSLDSSFDIGTGVDEFGINAIAVQPDGKVLLTGNFTKFNGVLSRRVVRLHSDGSVDTSFQIAGGGFDSNGVGPLAIQPDGKILIGGYFNSFNGRSHEKLVRLNSNGSEDTSVYLDFESSGVTPEVKSIKIQTDGKILIGGRFNRINGQNYTNLARLNVDGTLDTTFKPALNLGEGGINAIAVQSDSKIIAGGYANGIAAPSAILNRFNPDGTLEQAFPLERLSSYVEGIAIQSDGKILVAGSLQSYNDQVINSSLIRIYPDGTRDNTFALQAAYVFSIALQADNKILIGGNFSSVNGYTKDGVARLQANDSCNLLIVTNNSDDGQASQCGTFSYALTHATSGQTIVFGLAQGNKISFTGNLTPNVPAGVKIEGGANGTILDGNGISGDGLRLAGNNALTKLTIRGFAGRELVLTGSSGNWLYQVHAQN